MAVNGACVETSRGGLAGHSGHAGQHSGKTAKVSGITPERCPACVRNTVRHHTGMVSGMGRNAQEPICVAELINKGGIHTPKSTRWS